MTTAIAVYTSEGCVGRCDAKCHNATAPDCDCICGGRLHGTGSQAIKLQTEWIDPDGELRRRFAQLHGHDPADLRLEFGQQELFPTTNPAARRDTNASTHQPDGAAPAPPTEPLPQHHERRPSPAAPPALQTIPSHAGTAHAHSTNHRAPTSRSDNENSPANASGAVHIALISVGSDPALHRPLHAHESHSK